jgi:nicotinamidase-related amidase
MNNTALVLVDPYNDFLADDGVIWPRVREVAESTGTRQHLIELVTAVRGAGIPVAYAPHRRSRKGDTEGWLRPARPAMAIRAGAFAADGKGGRWYPGLEPHEGDIVASEHWAENGFFLTDLDMHLRQHGIDHIILAGMTAPGCVEGTGRYAMELSYGVTLVKDATASFSKEWMHAAVELNAQLYANPILTTTEVIERIGG